jgi:superfamily I DNA/RNA helicase
MSTGKHMSDHRKTPSPQPDEFQNLVIFSSSRAIRVVAPAGSGKTEALVRRCIEQVRSGKCAPEKMLVLSFTESAANNFRRRYRALAPQLPQPRIERLGRFASRILQDHFGDELASREGRDSKKNKSRIGALKRTFDEQYGDIAVLEWDGERRKVSKTITDLKQQGFSPGGDDGKEFLKWLGDQYLRLPTGDRSVSLEGIKGPVPANTILKQYGRDLIRIQEIYQEFDRELREQDLMEIVDYPLRAQWSLHRKRQIRTKIRSSIQEIVVDEFQDVSRLEALLIWELIGDQTRLVFAGDDDQAVFDWRGGSARFLLEAEKRFSLEDDIETVYLPHNYRTGESILAPAQRLIDRNQNRFQKSSNARVASVGNIMLIAQPSQPKLDAAIVQAVQDSLQAPATERETVYPKDVAVLCATPEVGERLEHAFRRAHIPTQGIEDGAAQTKPPGKVTLTTIRKGKSQQWRVVVLPDCSDALIPGHKQLSSSDMEAERRHMYVGMTRAVEELVVGYVRRDDHDEAEISGSGQVLATNGASRFLFEAGLVVPGSAADIAKQSNGAIGHQESTFQNQAQASKEGDGTEKPKAPPVPRTGLETAPSPAPEKTPSGRVLARSGAPVLQRHQKAPGTAVAPRSRGTGHSDLTQEERDAYEESQTLLLAENWKFASIGAYNVIDQYLKRQIDVSKVVKAEKYIRYVEVINAAYDQGIVDRHWRDTLHDWRMIRGVTKGMLSSHSVPASSQKTIRDMISGIPELVAHVRSDVRPSEFDVSQSPSRLVDFAGIIPDGNDQKLMAAYKVFDSIRGGSKGEQSKRFVDFEPNKHAELVLLIQMLLICNDFRFHIERPYRWNRSPQMHQFFQQYLGGTASFIRPDSRHGLLVEGQTEQLRFSGRLAALVERELGPKARAHELHRVIRQAVFVDNGSYSRGIVFSAH